LVNLFTITLDLHDITDTKFLPDVQFVANAGENIIQLKYLLICCLSDASTILRTHSFSPT